jgi:hypothetical protein
MGTSRHFRKAARCRAGWTKRQLAGACCQSTRRVGDEEIWTCRTISIRRLSGPWIYHQGVWAETERYITYAFFFWKLARAFELALNIFRCTCGLSWTAEKASCNRVFLCYSLRSKPVVERSWGGIPPDSPRARFARKPLYASVASICVPKISVPELHRK